MSKGELFNHNNESKLDSKNKYEETPATSLNENENKINIDENSEKDKKKIKN